MKKLLRLLCVVVLLPSLATSVLAENDPDPSPPSTESDDRLPSPSASMMEEEKSADEEVELAEVPPEESDESSDISVEESGPLEVSLGFGEGESLQHAMARMRLSPASASSSQLMSQGFIASYDAPNAPGKYRFFAMMSLNGRPAYCLEPGISNGLEDGTGPFYSASMEKLSGDLQQRVKRIAYFGYGHPMTGSSYDAYIATQLLIWKEIQAPLYQHIYSTFQKCGTPRQQLRACSMGQDGIDGLMSSIMNLVDNYDRVPSFADSWHGIRHYSLGWDETLSLTDTEGILQWFEDDSKESHAGIHLQRKGNTLHIDIDDLYYEGHDTVSGKTLTFQRRPELWNNMMAGAIVYTSGVYQKLFAETAEDPVPSYQLSFKLATADLKIQKVDEYGNPLPGQSAVYYLGWKEDPERQYHSDSLNDLRWRNNHGDRVTKDDADGQADQVGKERLYYPLLNPDGRTVRKFASDANGVLHISGLLPAGRTWWIQEVETSDAYLVNPDVWSMRTGSPGTTASASFANALRSVELELLKQDEEEPGRKINGAGIRIYETGVNNLSRDPMALGFDINGPRMNQPELTYWQLAEYSTLKPGDRFMLSDWQYEILKEENGVYSVQAKKPSSPSIDPVFSRYPFDGKQVGDTVVIEVSLNHHGTNGTDDDEKAVYPLRIESIEDDVLKAVHTGLFENVLVNANTVPDLETVQAACNRSIILPGQRFTWQSTSYTVGRVFEDSMIIHPLRTFTIDLKKATPHVSDLPDLRQIHVGESFGLMFDGEETLFTVLSKSDREVTLEHENGRDTIPLAPWISWQDVPEDVESLESFTITHIQEPEYVISDSRDHTFDLTPASVNGSLTYEELLNSADHVGPRGLETGYSFQKQMEKEEVLAIDPVTFEDITPEEKQSGQFTRNGRSFLIQFADDISVRASTIEDEKEFLLEIIAGMPASQAVHISLETVTFTVVDRKEKEIDLHWDTVTPGINSLTANGSLHLYAWADTESAETLQAEDVFGKNYAAGDVFTDRNGESYAVLFRDPLHPLYIVQSRKGRYEVRPEGVMAILPLSFWDYTDLEETNGHTFAVGETFSYPYRRRMVEGDAFLLEDRSFLLHTDAYEAVDGTTVLAQDPLYEKTIFYALEDDAPLKADELYQRIKRGQPLEQDGSVYRLAGGNGPEAGTYSGNTIRLEGEDGRCYSYVYAIVRDESERFPSESTQPQLIFQVKKEEGLSWRQWQMVLTGYKRPHQHVTLDDRLYEIVSADETMVVLQADDDPAETIDIQQDPDRFLQFSSTPLTAVTGDIFDYQGNSYMVQETGSGSHGNYVRLRRMSDHRSFLVEERVDPDTIEMEEIRFLKPQTVYDLKELFPKAASFTLARENPHAHIKDDRYLQSDANASVVLQLRDDAGYVMQERTIVFSTAENEHAESALPVFEGITGQQYVRLVDPSFHNRPLAWTTVDIYADEAMTHRLTSRTSSEYGVLETNGLGTGTFWYKHPLTAVTESFSVVDEERAEGTLSISGLKWGKTYMSCEWSLPEGYDYGTNEVCHRFTMNASPGTSRIQAALENRLRRLKVEVFKVDQDQRETRLDSAWFTLRQPGIQAKEEDSSFASRLTVSDLGKHAAAGDEVIVWRAKEKGATDIYRIEAVEEKQVTVSRLGGGGFSGVIPIPVHGVSASAPFLYQDLIRAAGELKKGTVVSIKEKQPRDQMRVYRIRSIEYGPGVDVFGQPVSDKVIQSAVLIEQGKDNAQPVTVRRNVPGNEGRIIGTYISGGIRIEKNMTLGAPLTFEQVKGQLKDSVTTGAVVYGRMPKTAMVPSYSVIYESDEGKETWTYEMDGVSWQIRKAEHGYDLTAHDQTVHLEEGVESGGVFWLEEEELRISSIEESEGVITSITITDGSSYWYLAADEEMPTITRGRPGVYVEVTKEDEDHPFFRGYTGMDGTIVLSSLAEGTYRVESEGNSETIHVSRGGFEVDGLRYGEPVELCETRSPLGYLVGHACTILVPKADYATDTVRNYRDNQRIRTRVEKVRHRRTGIA